MDDQKGIRILEVVLLESRFKRSASLQFDDKAKTDIAIDVLPKVDTEKGRIVTQVRLDVSAADPDENQFEAHIIMAGTFETKNIPVEAQENFSMINAAAIVFPFVREHLVNLSQKAGISLPMLNPVNFVALAEKRKERDQAPSDVQ